MESGTRRLVAHIHPDHAASSRVAAALGMAPAGVVDDDGEEIWELRPPD
jgi:RimJ/RimL family protein N-acetyltransferase